MQFGQETIWVDRQQIRAKSNAWNFNKHNVVVYTFVKWETYQTNFLFKTANLNMMHHSIRLAIVYHTCMQSHTRDREKTALAKYSVNFMNFRCCKFEASSMRHASSNRSVACHNFEGRHQSRKLKCSVSLSSFKCYHSKLANIWISLRDRRSEKDRCFAFAQCALWCLTLWRCLSNCMRWFGKCGH